MGVTESSIALKQSVFGLWHKGDVLPEDEMWEKFYTLPESADDVFQLISHNDLSELTLSIPPPDPGGQIEPRKNLETLIYNVIARLQLILTGSLHKELPPSDINHQILNCLRILTRILPCIYQAQHLKDWHDRFFWHPRRPTFLFDTTFNKRGPLFDGLNPKKGYNPDDLEVEIDRPLGETLIDVVIDLFFFPGFAVPARVTGDGSLDLSTQTKLWQTGIGVPTTSQPSTKENERHQGEIVRLLLAISSKTMYIQPYQVPSTEIKALTYLTTQLRSTTMHAVVCSLMNTVLKYHPYTWNVPIDFSDNKKDPKKVLVSTAVQLLIVLVIYRPPSSPDVGKNAFREAIGKLYKPVDFQFIHEGMREVLSPPVNVSLIAIPGKEKQLPWAPEMISLLWELFQTNRRFRKYLIDLNSAMDYVILLLFYALDAMNKESKQGVLRMCVAVLQDLSVDEAFSKKLNMVFPYHDTLPTIMRVSNFHGSYADFLICSVHKIFFATKGKMWSADHNLLTIMVNIAPHQVNLARATSIKIMDMFHDLSSPANLLANGQNWTQLRLLLRVVEKTLARHPTENRRFVDVIVANSSRFKALQTLTLEGALAEAERLARERKDRGGDVPTAGAVSSPTAARLLPSESTRSTSTTRPTTLDHVEEDSAFTIGEDDEDGDVDGSPKPTFPSDGLPSSRAESVVKSPGLSEKARGKQPAVNTTSLPRSPSATSIPTLTPITTSEKQSREPLDLPFTPSQEWLDSWHPHLPLRTILKFIREYQTNRLKDVQPPDAAHQQPGRDQNPAQGAQSRETSQSSLVAGLRSTAGVVAPGHDGTLGGGREAREPAERGEPFEWTPVAIGWYNALIWSRVYLQEAETFQGAGGLYASTDVKLFKRAANTQQISLRSPKGAIDAVGASLAQRISSFSIK